MDVPWDISFDYDGTLTDAGVVEIGRDNAGVHVDYAPVRMALARGWSTVIMTCNDPSYVASKLMDAGIIAVVDGNKTAKCPPADWGDYDLKVMVTNLKAFARMYVDDHNIQWQYGDPLERITERMGELWT